MTSALAFENCIKFRENRVVSSCRQMTILYVGIYNLYIWPYKATLNIHMNVDEYIAPEGYKRQIAY